ncbi:hypothetical protein Cni_G15418 [Canna indica]|uniref:DUF4378 domain-containing protein n=1 Tax=Canna indica TaxID=4628 RepID=A0AAQ3KDC8_9LILI|nr:hypothetical protein Cni_G15418 [Canna indica]
MKMLYWFVTDLFCTEVLRFVEFSKHSIDGGVMGGERGGSKTGGFFHLFDWNRKSRKKLFSNSPEGSKQGKRSSDTLPITQLRLIDDEEIFGGPSFKGSSDYSCGSSVTDEEGNGTRAPGVVARLMGLDSMPTSGVSEPYSTPFFDARSLRDNHSQRSPDFYPSEKFSHVPHKAEGYFRKPIETRSQKMPSSPIERFQREVLPPRLGKPLPLTHHKLLSPIKTPGFTSAKNATQIMEAAAKIIEPGLQIHPSTKGKIGSPSVPIRVRDPKDSIAAQERTSRLLQLSRAPVELADVQYSRGQSLNRSWNRTEDIVIVRSSPDPYELNATGARSKGKSISLAIQAKVNVQKRESLGTSSRSALVQKEHEDYKVNQPFRTQSSNQKNKLSKKPSTANASGVLRQNNQKQNCQSGKSKLGTKQSISHQHGRKILSGDPSSGKSKNANKLSGNTRVGSRKQVLETTGLDMEGSSSNNKDFPQKKRLIEGSFNPEKSSTIYNGLMNRHEANVKPDMLIDQHTRRTEDNRNATDIISFTFTSPLVKTFGGSQSCNLVVDNWDKRNGCSFENNFSENKKSIPSVGLNVLSGDALSHLLEQKLRELTSSIEPSCDFTRAAKLATSSPTLQDSCSPSNSLSTLTTENDEFLPRPCKDKPSSVLYPAVTSSGQGIGVKNKLQVAEGVESSNIPACLDPNYNHQSPLSVFDASFSSESWQLSESSGSTDGSNLCPSSSVNAQNNVHLHSSTKPVETETELSDSASSLAKESLEQLHITNNTTANEKELKCVREILCKQGLMYNDLGSYYLTDKEAATNDKATSNLLFDCVQECLDLKHSLYFKAGYRAWDKGTMVTRDDLAQDIYDQISGWRSMGNWMVDELVANDMSTHLGKWVDFEIEAFETGKQIQKQILSSLIDEVLADFRIK